MITSKLHKFLAIAGALLLSACQTIPDPTGFNQEQATTLAAEGFVQNEGNYELGLPNRLLFGFDESELQSSLSTELARLSRTLVEVEIGGATIEGHTDNRGANAYNLPLSKRRAETVKSALIAGGMNADAIRTIGYGEADPIEDNATKAGRSENRRVVIIVSPIDIIRR